MPDAYDHIARRAAQRLSGDLGRNPIERLWGLMHRNVTHNKCYATCGHFADATLDFVRDKIPKNWRRCRDLVTDNFRVINPRIFGL